MSVKVPGGFMRQRYSQESVSSGEDLEEDTSPRTPMYPSVSKPRTWIEVMENIVWIASAIFFIYLGDRKCNLICILWRDIRIKRTPLYLGFVGILMEGGIILCSNLFAWDIRFVARSEVSSPSIAPVMALLVLISFFLFSFALWPVWSFLALPLLVTLFMAITVISSYLPFGMWRTHDYTNSSDVF